MKKIIEYIKQKYEPLSIIVYGSYADGSNNENSDFDAMVISNGEKKVHDVSFVDGVQLDVFAYPITYFDGRVDYDEIIQIFDGNIVMDTDEIGVKIKESVLKYIDTLPKKTHEEIATEIEWCKKMLMRTKRGDAEGMYRWHWLLMESLEIYCDTMDHPYWGPKKSLKWMEKEQPKAFTLYAKALNDMDAKVLEEWIEFLYKM